MAANSATVKGDTPDRRRMRVVRGIPVVSATLSCVSPAPWMRPRTASATFWVTRLVSITATLVPRWALGKHLSEMCHIWHYQCHMWYK